MRSSEIKNPDLKQEVDDALEKITNISDQINSGIKLGFTGKKITVSSNRLNPGATTTISVRGVDSNLTKTIVVTVESDTINQTISPFDGSVVVTDNRYY